MPASLRLEIVDRCVARIGDQVVTPRADRLFAGLLVLGLDRGRPRGRDEFAELLWPGVGESIRRARLRWLLTKIRNTGLSLDTDGETVALARERVEIDLVNDETLARATVGDLLPGYAPDFSGEFVAWLDERRSELSGTLLRRLESMMLELKRRAVWDGVLTAARGILRIDPENEGAVLALAESCCRQGDRVAATRHLEAYIADIGDRGVERQVRARAFMRRIERTAVPERIGESPFVGRGDHLTRIDSLLADARRGSGGALILAGPAGIGKTRLLEESRALASIAGMQCVRIRCHREDAQRPLSGIAELIPLLLSLPGAAGCDPIHLQRLRRLTEPLSSSASGSMSSDAESPGVAREQLVTALIDLLDAISAETALLIQLDDAQWVDRSLNWLWRDLLEWTQTHAIGWLFAVRTSRREGPALEAPTLPIGSLALDQATELLDSLSATMSRAMSAEVRDALVARGAGSPLFLGELARQWAEAGVVDALPSSLHRLVDRGLAQLSPEALRTLQVAAVLGAHATVDRIERVLGMSRPSFVSALIELDASGILTTDQDGLAFGHVLWAEAALTRLAPSIAIVLHRHAAQQFDAELVGRADPIMLWESARHWADAGQRDRARMAIVRGAEHLAENGFPGEAASALQRAIGMTQDAAEQLAILRRRVELLYEAGDFAETAAEIDRHEQLAKELAPSYSLHNDLELVRLETQLFEIGQTARCLAAAMACARSTLGTPEHRVRAARIAAKCADLENVGLLEELNTIVLDLGATRTSKSWDWLRVRFIFERRLGDVRIAYSLSEELVDRSRKSGKPSDLARALNFHGQALVLIGHFAKAREAFHEGLSIGQRLGLRHTVAGMYDQMMGLSFDVDAIEVTRELFDRARPAWLTASRLGSEAFTNLSLPSYASMLALREGRFADALAASPPLHLCMTFPNPRGRSRLAATQLAARMELGETDGLASIARAAEEGLLVQNDWLDWPAGVYASYLERFESHTAAAHFAQRFVTTIRRELYPAPALLLELSRGEKVPSGAASES